MNKRARLTFLITFLSMSFCFSNTLFAATKEFDFMGTRITLKSKSKKDLESLVKKIEENKSSFFKGLDNECLYKDAKTEECRAEIEYAFNTKVKLKSISAEAKKKYRPSFLPSDAEANKTALINGLSILEDSKSAASKAWQVNYNGQLFQSKGSEKSLYISSPLMPSVSFLSLPSYEGWAVSQSSDLAGGALVTKGKKSIKPDFLKIALFAGPDFSGARLYGWSKSLMVGGKKLLKKLEKNKEYKGKWGYMYFDRDAKLVCSRNLNCDLSNPKNRSARANW